MYGESSGFLSKVLENNLVSSVPGEVRQCFRIRTRSNLHVSEMQPHKELPLKNDLLAGGKADSLYSGLNKAKYSEAVTVTLSLRK